ncbi:MAG: DUF4293 domain-containing protein [Cyclobacteriaceae bacterium]|nr:DUF4293 domain-containing protein [Cyclobacteriaceae bacterium]
MIQRIQSVFLLLVAAAMIAMLFFPLWEKIDFTTSEVATMNAFSLKFETFDDATGQRNVIMEKNVLYISIGALLAALVALFSIFQYTNRLRQIQLGALNSFLIAATMGLALWFVFKGEALLAVAQQGNYLFGFYLPMGALVFNMLANRFIRRDEQLVRSADRLR